MNRFSDQALARIMLDLRQRGISFGLHIRRNSLFYGLFFGYFFVFLAVLAWMQIWPVFFICTGACIGALLRDIGWIRASRNSLPFTLKVTDWKQVEGLADGTQCVEPGDAADSR